MALTHTMSEPAASVSPAPGPFAGVSEVVAPLVLGVVAMVFAPVLHAVSPVLAIATQALIACVIALSMPGYTIVDRDLHAAVSEHHRFDHVPDHCRARRSSNSSRATISSAAR